MEKQTVLTTPASPTTNKHLIRWVEKMADLCQPERTHWIDGSPEENKWLCDGLVEAGTFTRLPEEKWPGCFYARSSPNDVAVSKTAPSSARSRKTPPPHQQLGRSLRHAQEAQAALPRLHARTHHVRHAVLDGPHRSPMSQIGVQLTDSAYAVVNMRIKARIGTPVYAEIDRDEKRVVPASTPSELRSHPARRMFPGPRTTPNTSSIPRDPRDLVLRFRLRRQRPAGQEVLCPAHCLEHCARRRLDGPSTCSSPASKPSGQRRPH